MYTYNIYARKYTKYELKAFNFEQNDYFMIIITEELKITEVNKRNLVEDNI